MNNIFFENNFDKLKIFLENNVFNYKKICVVTDENISNLYLKNITESDKVFHYVCKNGEKIKSFESAMHIYKFLIEKKFSRSDILIAFGGGVIGDLSGFIASTFMRGIKFVQIPTTLLAQTDSSIGGKNAINFHNQKNIIGTFYKPNLIYINIGLLKTLPACEFSNGMAEIIKHCLLDKTFYEFMCGQKNILKDEKILIDALKKSVRIKLDIIKNDMYDENSRHFLNFGHTFGHALEAVSDFSFTHGKAVSLGIIFALYLSCTKRLKTSVLEKTSHILETYNLPTKMSGLNKNLIYEKMLSDKKCSNSKINIVLLNEIGKPIINGDITKDEIFDAMNYLER